MRKIISIFLIIFFLVALIMFCIIIFKNTNQEPGRIKENTKTVYRAYA